AHALEDLRGSDHTLLADVGIHLAAAEKRRRAIEAARIVAGRAGGSDHAPAPPRHRAVPARVARRPPQRQPRALADPDPDHALPASDAQVLPSMPTAGAFTWSSARVIHWGAGSVAQLGAELRRLEATRIGVVTSRSLVESLDRLGVRPAATVVIGQDAPTAQV